MSRSASVVWKVSIDTVQWDVASERLRLAVWALADAMVPGRRRPPVWRPAPHAFMPDFDLACTVAGCALLAEEH